jgi:hypothetical protein
MDLFPKSELQKKGAAEASDFMRHSAQNFTKLALNWC